ncbi:TMEM175 family protein [Leifsonia poae]|uniref:TMEM175 family protein n=1 Tax=Leifsonia poae TaxID=110933 RepID=UPI003D67B349
MTAIRTERGLDRLVNFSDATVAIAITLLILPLVDIAAEISKKSVGELVVDHQGQFIVFVVSFWLIGRFWIIHHRLFEWVDNYSTGLIWANMLWLASIVFIPFTANALANSDGDRADVYALYIGAMIVTAGSTVLIEVVLVRSPHLLRDDSRGQIDLVRSSVPSVILAVCLVLAVLVPQVGLYWLILLFLTSPAYAVLGRLSRRRGSQTGS